jgi:hypothetical protein
MTTFFIILLLILVAVGILAFVTLPAAVKIAVEKALEAELQRIAAPTLSIVRAAQSEVTQLEADAKDVVDKAKAEIAALHPAPAAPPAAQPPVA